MERRGVYRKGSAGHVRNASAYLIARQHFKQWRVPVTILAGFFILFSVSPMVGEQLAASVLTSQQMSTQVTEKPAEARKAMLEYLHDFSKDCQRFLMDECVSATESVIAKVADQSTDVKSVLTEAVAVEDRFGGTVAHSACKFDVGQLGLSLEAEAKTLTAFNEKFAESLGDKSMISALDSLRDAAEKVKALGEACQYQ